MAGRLPLLPTMMVALAVPLLIGLGIWQVHRAEWKAGLLAQLEANSRAPLLDIGTGPVPEDAQFRKVRADLVCDGGEPIIRAGRNMQGRPGYSHLAQCRVGKTDILLDSFWAPRPDPMGFATDDGSDLGVATGSVEGVMVRRADGGWLLVLADPKSPATTSAPPTIDTIPNNHRAYAVQWFSFAAILAVIYGLWLRRWLAQPGARP